jgi:hypothetical protein
MPAEEEVATMLRLRRIGLMLLSASLAALLLGLGAWLLSGATPVRAQMPGGQTPNRPASVEADVDATNFPTVTLSFPCASPGEGYQVLENGVVITNVTLATRSEPVDTRVAMMLDLFRARTGGGKSQLPLAITSTLNAVEDVVRDLESRHVFMVPVHQLGIFALARDIQQAVSIYPSGVWTDDLGSLINTFYTATVAQSELIFPDLGGPVTATKLLDTVNNLLSAELAATDAPRRQALLVFSDGSDGGSVATVESVVEAARLQNIPIYTVFVPTSQKVTANTTRLQQLAGGGGGFYEEAYTNTASIAGWLAAIYAPQRVCDLSYRVQQNPPARVEVQSVGGAQPSTVATALLPATLRREAPQVRIDSPRFGQTYTLTTTETVALAVTWEAATGDDIRAAAVELTVLGPGAAGDQQIITSHVATLTAAAPMSYRFEVNATALLAGQHLLRAVVTDDFGLVGTAEQPFAMQPLPTPTPSITPLHTLIAEGAREKWTDAGNWLWEDDGTRLILFILVALYAMILALFGLLFFREWRVEPASRGEVGVSAVTEYAILDRVQMSERVPHTKQIIRLDLNSSEQLELPGIFLEDDSAFYRGDELASFLLAYRATLQCDGATVNIRRPSSTDANSTRTETLHYDTIEILKFSANTTFALDAGKKHELRNNDIVQFGDLHYKFVRMQRSDV